MWSVWRWHDGVRWSDGWYGNLESPWQRSEIGYDSQDWALDVVAAGTPGAPNWVVGFKDEDELEWMVGQGAVSGYQAAFVREAGERLMAGAVTAGWPFDADWDQWLPDPSWQSVSLPPTWLTTEPTKPPLSGFRH